MGPISTAAGAVTVDDTITVGAGPDKGALLGVVRVGGRPLGPIMWGAAERADTPAAALVEDAEAQVARLASTVPDPIPMSVVIATRHRPEHLDRCLNSIVLIEHPCFEVIVVDNGPDDPSTRAVVARHAAAAGQTCTVRYLAEPVPGASRARNRGWRAARYATVAFCDDDCVVDRYWLEGLTRAFCDEDVAAVTGQVLPAALSTDAQVYFEEYGGFGRGPHHMAYDMAGHRPPSPFFPYTPGRFGSGNNVAFRRTVLEDLGGFSEAIGPGTPASAGEDLDLFVRVVLSGGRLDYEPSALIRHEHRRTIAELETQLRSYGVGLSVMVLHLAMANRAAAWQIAKLAVPGIRLVLSPKSEKNQNRTSAYPRPLARAELSGIIRGPMAYASARRAHRRLCARRPDVLVVEDFVKVDGPAGNRADSLEPPMLGALAASVEGDGHGLAMPVAVSGAELITGGAPLTPAGALGVPRRLRTLAARIGGDDLYRNGLTLAINTVFTGALGLAYWAVAARYFDADDVGRALALISAMTICSGVAQLNMLQGLPRFLPIAGTETGRLVRGSYLVCLTMSAVAAVVMLVGGRLTGWGQGYLATSPAQAGWFVVAVVAWTAFTLQDAVLIGLRQAVWVPIENILFSLVKIALLVVTAQVVVSDDVFLSFTLPVALSLVPISLLLFKRLIPRQEAAAAGGTRIDWRVMRTHLTTDYIGSLAYLASMAGLPLIVAAGADLNATAYFATTWTLAASMDLVLTGFTSSLLVEASDDPARLGVLTRRLLRLCAAVVLPALGLIVVAAPSVLGILGTSYADRATGLLRLVAIAAATRIVTLVAFACWRVRHQVRNVLVAQWVLSGLTISLGSAAIGPFGIVGVGWAVLCAQGLVAAACAPTVVRAVRGSLNAAPARATQHLVGEGVAL